MQDHFRNVSVLRCGIDWEVHANASCLSDNELESCSPRAYWDLSLVGSRYVSFRWYHVGYPFTSLPTFYTKQHGHASPTMVQGLVDPHWLRADGLHTLWMGGSSTFLFSTHSQLATAPEGASKHKIAPSWSSCKQHFCHIQFCATSCSCAVPASARAQTAYTC